MSRALDPSDATALHEQAAAQIRRSIAEGDAKPGDRLPSARDLAAVMGVNANTVLRALRSLRDEGVVEFRRGRGVTVCGTRERVELLERCRDLLAYARAEGYRRDELVALLESLQ